MGIEYAHKGPITSIAYNPHRPHHLATAGQDRFVRLWDLRQPITPLAEFRDHTHWYLVLVLKVKPTMK